MLLGVHTPTQVPIYFLLKWSQPYRYQGVQGQENRCHDHETWTTWPDFTSLLWLFSVMHLIIDPWAVLKVKCKNRSCSVGKLSYRKSIPRNVINRKRFLNSNYFFTNLNYNHFNVTSDALKFVPDTTVKHYWVWYDF